MTTATGAPLDPGDHTDNHIDGTTSQLPLPLLAKGGLYCTTSKPPSGMSALLAAVLCIAAVITVAAVVLAFVEETRNAPVTHTTMHLLVASGVVAWISAIIVAFRDQNHRNHQGLRSAGETVQARQQELAGRQDLLARRIADLENRLAEQTQLLRRVAEGVDAVRREMSDVIGVADADAELQLRLAVNDHRSSPALYVVPPEN